MNVRKKLEEAVEGCGNRMSLSIQEGNSRAREKEANELYLYVMVRKRGQRKRASDLHATDLEVSEVPCLYLCRTYKEKDSLAQFQT